MKIKRLILCMAAVFCVLVMCGANAFAAVTEGFDTGAACSLTVHIENDRGEIWAAEGAQVTVYKAADMSWSDDGLEYSLTKDFLGLSEELDPFSDQQAAALAQMAASGSVSGTALMADQKGAVSFTGLTPGLYLVVETDHAKNTECFEPFMVTLPLMNDGEWQYDVDADPKLFPVTDSSSEELVSVSVLKVWTDDGKNRPESVTVRLVNSKGVFDTVTLSSDNEWKHTWKDLDKNEKWDVQETDIPEGYTVSYKKEGLSFTVINTENTPPGETLIQTGQLNWPIPVLAGGGTLLIVLGLALKSSGRKSRNEN